MNILKVAAAAALTCAMSASSAFSAGMEFKIHNKSDYVINGFYVQGKDGSLSDNWMNFELNGNESANMKFDYDGDCDIVFVVAWAATDGSEIKGDPTSIDICKADNIYFDGKEATYD
ncbi:MAG TPA: hypothetical protein VN112_15930 [Ensifer sp.]|nr:hypothetical protein [Ensifer sp.]